MRRQFWVIVSLLALLNPQFVSAQEDESRRIWAEAYTKKEVKEKKPVTQTAPRIKKKKAVQYKVTTPQIQAETVVDETVVGVTIWRLRSAAENEQGVMIGDERLIAERVEGSTSLSPGDRVRLTVEAARDGYLYVFNREQYSDGTLGDPYLIFPTSRLDSGNNNTTLGRVIVLPSQKDKPPYFTLTPGRPDQIAEILSVFITSEPLENIKIGEQALQIPSAQLTEWETRWGKTIGRLELVGGAGTTWTPAEQDAGTGARLLKHTDPSPQSVYYNPTLKSGDPIFVNVNLQYGSKSEN